MMEETLPKSAPTAVVRQRLLHRTRAYVAG